MARCNPAAANRLSHRIADVVITAPTAPIGSTQPNQPKHHNPVGQNVEHVRGQHDRHAHHRPLDAFEKIAARDIEQHRRHAPREMQRHPPRPARDRRIEARRAQRRLDQETHPAENTARAPLATIIAAFQVDPAASVLARAEGLRDQHHRALQQPDRNQHHHRLRGEAPGPRNASSCAPPRPVISESTKNMKTMPARATITGAARRSVGQPSSRHRRSSRSMASPAVAALTAACANGAGR